MMGRLRMRRAVGGSLASQFLAPVRGEEVALRTSGYMTLLGTSVVSRNLSLLAFTGHCLRDRAHRSSLPFSHSVM